MIKKTIIFLLCLPFAFSSYANENFVERTGNFQEWLAIHNTYMLALDQIHPDSGFSSIEFDESDFRFLQEDAEAREGYLELIAHAEQFCEMNRSIAACDNLLQVIEEKSLIACFGDIELLPSLQGVRNLQDSLETVWLASSQNEFKSYSESAGVDNMITRMKANLTLRCTETSQNSCRTNRRPGTLGQCLRYMKLGLIGGGYIRSNPGVASASRFGPELKKMGFRNLKEDPRHANMSSRQAPHGAILVYSSSDPKRPHGHIEIYDSKSGQYISDFASNNPIDTYNGRRTLIGIYVK